MYVLFVARYSLHERLAHYITDVQLHPRDFRFSLPSFELHQRTSVGSIETVLLCFMQIVETIEFVAWGSLGSFTVTSRKV